MLSINDFLTNYPIGPAIHYVAIGSAANLEIKNLSVLAPGQMQQYPPFLARLHKTPIGHSQYCKRIILIDPDLEDPPYIITAEKRRSFFESDKLKAYKGMLAPWRLADYDIEKIPKHIGWILSENYSNVYKSSEGNIEVYAFREWVTYYPHSRTESDKMLDITQMLKIYHTRCLDSGGILFAHDFSGRSISSLADYFSKTLEQNQKYIMYDITLRKNFSCFVDLQETCNDPIILSDSGRDDKNSIKLQIFNPFAIPNNEMRDLYRQLKELVNKVEAGKAEFVKVQLVQLKSVIKTRIDSWLSLWHTYVVLNGYLNELLLKEKMNPDSFEKIMQWIGGINKPVTHLMPAPETIEDAWEIFEKFKKTRRPDDLKSTVIGLEMSVVPNCFRYILDLFQLDDLTATKLVVDLEKIFYNQGKVQESIDASASAYIRSTLFRLEKEYLE